MRDLSTTQIPSAEELADKVEDEQTQIDHDSGFTAEVERNTAELEKLEQLGEMYQIDEPAPLENFEFLGTELRLGFGWNDLQVPEPFSTVAKEIVARTGTAPQFAIGLSMQLLNSCLGRRTLIRTPFAPHGIAPNGYYCFIAPSSRWHKSTAMNVGRFWQHEAEKLANMKVQLPEDFTAEGLTKYLHRLQEEDKPTGGLVTEHEIASWFSSYNRRFQTSRVPFLLKAYDAETWYRIRADDEKAILIEQPYLSVIGLTHPRTLARHMRPEASEDGFRVRFRYDMPYESQNNALRHTATQETPDAEIVKIFLQFLTAPPQDFTFDYKTWNEWRRWLLITLDENNAGDLILATAERESTRALKDTISFAIGRYTMDSLRNKYGQSTTDDLEQAKKLAVYYIQRAVRLDELLRGQAITASDMDDLLFLLNEMNRAGLPCTRNNIRRKFRRGKLKTDEIQDLLNRLKNVPAITMIEDPYFDRTGRQRTRTLYLPTTNKLPSSTKY